MVRSLALALFLLPLGAQAGSAQGPLLVSVTIVATCGAGSTAAASVAVQCPEQQPFHVRVSPVAAVKRGVVDTSTAQTFSGNGRVALSAQNDADNHASAAHTTAVNDGARPVTVLTVSY